MRRSTERFLTTHTGSLPRPDDLIRMMYAKEEGVPVDRAALAARVRAAVAEVVKKQADAGIDYRQRRRNVEAELRHLRQGPARRLRRHRQHLRLPGPRRLPEPRETRVRRSRAARAARPRPATRRSRCAMPRRRATTSPISRARSPPRSAATPFMSAASPGVISLFFRNDHYKDHETYLFAIADAMRHEYETVAKAGFVLQIDCPDLAMGRHIQYADLELAEFRKRAGMHIAALNHALANIPPSSCACICAGATTRARTTATCRSPTSSTSCSRRARARSRSRPPIRAMPTNGRCSSA